MAAIDTSWLIGSFTLATNATIVINGSNAVIAAGDYYLRDASAGISLIATMQTALAAFVAGTTVYIGKDRKLRIDGNGNVLTLSVPADIRDVTGLEAAPTPAIVVAAASISPLHWSPGWPETPMGNPTGTTGRVVYDRVQQASPTGLTTRTTLHHSTTVARWAWFAVSNERVWSTGDDNGVSGEYIVFWTYVLNPGLNFKLYPEVSEDSAVTTTVTWPTALGPYVAHDLDQDWYTRRISNSDEWANIELKAHVVTEIAN